MVSIAWLTKAIFIYIDLQCGRAWESAHLVRDTFEKGSLFPAH
jgi:hypothetical protein